MVHIPARDCASSVPFRIGNTGIFFFQRCFTFYKASVDGPGPVPFGQVGSGIIFLDPDPDAEQDPIFFT
jgi:hypothetical protein